MIPDFDNDKWIWVCMMIEYSDGFIEPITLKREEAIGFFASGPMTSPKILRFTYL